MLVVLTERLELRTMIESDREQFIELFTDPAFMVFSDGAHSLPSANRYVDHLLTVNEELPFAKQPIMLRGETKILGYAGVDWFDLEGEPRLEFGYRLVPEARGRGYATEASTGLLDSARSVFEGTIYAIIHGPNAASISTIQKLGFEFWKEDNINDELRNLYRWLSTPRFSSLEAQP